MSIKALNWAMQQVRADGPSAQAVLFIVADVANAEGVSRHADPDYIAERSRQARATVFRRLAELEHFGALTRLTVVEPDGRRRYEIHLKLGAEIDYDGKSVDAWRKGQESEESQAEEHAPESQIETHPQSQIETQGVAPVRLGESHSCDSQKNPRDSKKEPPNPPAGGDRGAIDPVLEADIAAAASAYPIPITAMAKFRAIFASLAPPTRKSVLLAINGYAAFLASCEKKGKPRAAKDAHRWVQNGDWQGYVAEGQKAAERAKRCDIREGSAQWRAWDVFYRCCGKSMGIPGYAMTGERGHRLANVPQEWPPLVGDDPGPSDWLRFGEGSREFAAWRDRLRELPGLGALPAVLTVPAQWPPSKSHGTGPPESLCTEADVRDLSKMA